MAPSARLGLLDAGMITTVPYGFLPGRAKMTDRAEVVTHPRSHGRPLVPAGQRRAQATVMTTLPRACPCSRWRRPSAVSASG
jgi:hypothetical protein